MQTTNNLFVYGTLRRDFRNPMAQQLAQKADFMGLGQTQGRLYDLGSFPGMVQSFNPHEVVKGEVYALHNPSHLLNMFDKYEGYIPNHPKQSNYLRKKVSVTLDGGQELEAWVYFYNGPTIDQKVVTSGDYVKYVKSKHFG